MPPQISQFNEPFWVDDPNPYYRSSTTKEKKGSLTWWISKTILVYSIFIFVTCFGFLIILAINIPIFWIFVAFEALAISEGLYLRRFRKADQAKIVRIQQHAKELTGADFLGSAIHTAGHPLLQINQPIVFALKKFELSIYCYEDSTPIDTLSVNSITNVSLVVYDDEYIPHVGVIDNTAQALQISIKHRNSEYICSFRRMYKIRPIEWYQIIQKARHAEKATYIKQV
jgi:hypothetical protein